MLLRRFAIFAALALGSAAPTKRCSGPENEPGLPANGGGESQSALTQHFPPTTNTLQTASYPRPRREPA